MKKNFSFWQDAYYRFCKNKASLFSFFMLCFLIIMAIIGPSLNQYSYYDTHLDLKNTPPSYLFWFGSDELGRDVFTRIWLGARISLSIGFIAAFIDLIIGVIWGMIAAYSKNIIDEIEKSHEVYLSARIRNIRRSGSAAPHRSWSPQVKTERYSGPMCILRTRPTGISRVPETAAGVNCSMTTTMRHLIRR